MNTAGLILMLGSWAVVIALNAFCIYKMLKMGKHKGKEEG